MTPLVPLLLAALAGAQPVNPAEPSEALEAALAAIGVSREDLDLRPDRWETRLTLPTVERHLKSPLGLAAVAESWSREAGLSRTPAALLSAAAAWLDGKGPPPSSGEPRELLPGILQAWGDAGKEVSAIAEAVETARRSLRDSLAALSPQGRSEAHRTLFPEILASPAKPRPNPAGYEAASLFPARHLPKTAMRLCQAIEAGMPRLRSLARPDGGERRWVTPAGAVLVSAQPHRTFTPSELRDVAVLIRAGESTIYRSAVAAAQEGQVRVVLDFSPEVTIESPPDAGGAGSGVFGIGILYLPNPAGRKSIRTGDLSLGAGFFGAGVAWIAGRSNTLSSGRFSQGAGAFGAGVLVSESSGGTIAAHLASQGFGFTNGVGILKQNGDGNALSCGLETADPREAEAALSLCQGAGLGPRAFAAGGIGLAAVTGDRNTLQASYFAQGSGYWHGLGGLAVKGNANKLIARRYSQGAGVHAALGFLQMDGNGNRLDNWGVGPAFGWDYGAGYALIRGDDNSARADWGTGRGDANGHGLAVVLGEGNKLSLPEFGSGAMRRFAPSYGIAAVRGSARLRFATAAAPIPGPLRLSLGPWGVVHGDSALLLDPGLSLPVERPPFPARETQATRERMVLESLWSQAQGLQGPERLPALLHLASSAGLDATVPRRARRELAALPAQRCGELAAHLSPERFDEMIWLRVLLASCGPRAAAWALGELPAAAGLRKALLLGVARGGHAAQAIEPLLSSLRDPDWRVRRDAAAGLGGLWSWDRGEEPGRLVLLEKVAGVNFDSSTAAGMGLRRPGELLSVLALDPGLPDAERAAFVDSLPTPTEPVPKEILEAFLAILSRRAQPYRTALTAELESTRSLAPKARAGLLKSLEDADDEVVMAALAGLGQHGLAEDAPALAARLEHPSAPARDAAAQALGRMGPAAAAEIEKALASPSPRTRVMAGKAAAQSWDPAVVGLLERAFSDPDVRVRAAAPAALGAVQGPLSGERRRFRAAIESLLQDPDPSVRANAAYAKSAIPAD